MPSTTPISVRPPLAHVVSVGRPELFCQAEVEHFHTAIVRHHDVARLEIAVHDAFVMRRCERIRQRRADRKRPIDGQAIMWNELGQPSQRGAFGGGRASPCITVTAAGSWPMLVYHRTNVADDILRDGFRDGEAGLPADRALTVTGTRGAGFTRGIAK